MFNFIVLLTKDIITTTDFIKRSCCMKNNFIYYKKMLIQKSPSRNNIYRSLNLIFFFGFYYTCSYYVPWLYRDSKNQDLYTIIIKTTNQTSSSTLFFYIFKKHAPQNFKMKMISFFFSNSRRNWFLWNKQHMCVTICPMKKNLIFFWISVSYFIFRKKS